MLKASDALQSCLVEIGKKEHLPAANVLFREDCDNVGVFLVVEGKVCLGLTSIPSLDRLFGSGALLGLPSTFAGRPYSLTATTVTTAELVHVAQGDFLRLMHERPDLCDEATNMLVREMTFIKSMRRSAQDRSLSRDPPAVP